MSYGRRLVYRIVEVKFLIGEDYARTELRSLVRGDLLVGGRWAVEQSVDEKEGGIDNWFHEYGMDS